MPEGLNEKAIDALCAIADALRPMRVVKGSGQEESRIVVGPEPEEQQHAVEALLEMVREVVKGETIRAAYPDDLSAQRAHGEMYSTLLAEQDVLKARLADARLGFEHHRDKHREYLSAHGELFIERDALKARVAELEYVRAGEGQCDCDHAPCRHDAYRAFKERDALKVQVTKVEEQRDSFYEGEKLALKQAGRWQAHAENLAAVITDIGTGRIRTVHDGLAEIERGPAPEDRSLYCMGCEKHQRHRYEPQGEDLDWVCNVCAACRPEVECDPGGEQPEPRPWPDCTQCGGHDAQCEHDGIMPESVGVGLNHGWSTHLEKETDRSDGFTGGYHAGWNGAFAALGQTSSGEYTRTETPKVLAAYLTLMEKRLESDTPTREWQLRDVAMLRTLLAKLEGAASE